MSGPKRVPVPKRFQHGIESWLPSLTKHTYSFPMSPTKDSIKRDTICIGDIHGDPRGLITALLIGSCINRQGHWIGGNRRVIMLGDVLDGAERIGTNPDITMWDELLCLRILFELKEESHHYGGSIVWVLGNHDIMAPLGQNMYLNATQAKGYGEHGRQFWFTPGSGILAYYMARCSILCGVFGQLLVSHAGILPSHLPHCVNDTKSGATYSMRLWLMRGYTTPIFRQWYHPEGPCMHRQFDVPPGSKVPTKLIDSLIQVGRKTNTTIQVIGHNYRPGVQKISAEQYSLFFVDTGISRSFGPDTNVQVLHIDQVRNNYGVFSVA